MTDNDTPEVLMVYETYGTTTHVPLSEVTGAIKHHSKQIHDGDDIAWVDPEVIKHATDLAVKDTSVLEDEG